MAAVSPLLQNGIVNFFWPNPVTHDGQVNHQGMIRRMETLLGLMIPGSAAFYMALEYCQCPHSGMITLICSVPIPALFVTLDEYWADSAVARIEALRQKRLKSSQIPPYQPTPPTDRRRDAVSSAVTNSSTQSPKSILKNSGGVGKSPPQEIIKGSTPDTPGSRRRVGITKSSSFGPQDYEDPYGYPLSSLPELKVKS